MVLKTLALMALVTAPATCQMAGTGVGDEPLRDISPAAMAALPAGVDPGFLIRDDNGCYGIEIEVTDPPSGVALSDATGQQVCDI